MEGVRTVVEVVEDYIYPKWGRCIERNERNKLVRVPDIAGEGDERG